MKKIYAIEVDCANCANLMEETAKKMEGIENASVNFMTQKMTVEFSQQADENAVMKKLIKACKKIEPDFNIEF
ncbi:cation transporter [Treponema sp.]|uniref:cation transporter n=1 Tax=Treponema sp. TaxID=166 RepID=UPI003F1203A7